MTFGVSPPFFQLQQKPADAGFLCCNWKTSQRIEVSRRWWLRGVVTGWCHIVPITEGANYFISYSLRDWLSATRWFCCWLTAYLSRLKSRLMSSSRAKSRPHFMEATKCIVNGDSNECYQSFTVKRTATPPFKLTAWWFLLAHCDLIASYWRGKARRQSSHMAE